jgi:4-hydroxy-3-methylbut-2-enyl diphosphate reductase
MFIKLSRYSGLCFGVSRAVKTVFEYSAEGIVYLLGEIAHNRLLIEKIKKNKNLKIVENCGDIPNGSVVIIRAHGEKESIFEKLKEKNLKIVDMTCPKVKAIHKIVKNESKKNKRIIIIGNPNHPEVIGISGYCEKFVVIKNFDEARNFVFKGSIDFPKNGEEYCLVVQTTYEQKKFEEILLFLRRNIKNIKFYNTICNDSVNRKKELNELASKFDLIIVVGDKKSSNSTKLFELSRNICKSSLHIESFVKISKSDIAGKNNIFITGSASTLSETVTEVKKRCCQIASLETKNP